MDLICVDRRVSKPVVVFPFGNQKVDFLTDNVYVTTLSGRQVYI